MVNPPPLQAIPKDTGKSRHIPIRPDNWVNMDPKGKGKWYDEHWAEFEALVKEVGLKKARKAFRLTIATYSRIAARHTDTARQSLQVAPNESVPAPDEQILPPDERIQPSDEPEPPVEEIVPPEPEPAVAEGTPPQRRQSQHGYYEEHKAAILADAAALGIPSMLKKWGIPSSSWTYMRRRWIGEPSRHTKHPSSNKVKAAPKVTPEPLEQEVELVADTRVTRRNQGMTGIRRLYPL